jgi:hypothetical protein
VKSVASFFLEAYNFRGAKSVAGLSNSPLFPHQFSSLSKAMAGLAKNAKELRWVHKLFRQTRLKYFPVGERNYFHTRKVALSQAAQRAKRFQAVTGLNLAEAATREIWPEEAPFALLLCREVFTREDARQDTRYLVTGEVTLASQQMSALYQRRWSIGE